MSDIDLSFSINYALLFSEMAAMFLDFLLLVSGKKGSCRLEERNWFGVEFTWSKLKDPSVSLAGVADSFLKTNTLAAIHSFKAGKVTALCSSSASDLCERFRWLPRCGELGTLEHFMFECHSMLKFESLLTLITRNCRLGYWSNVRLRMSVKSCCVIGGCGEAAAFRIFFEKQVQKHAITFFL